MLAMYFIAELTESGEFRTGEKEWRRGCAMASVALALSVAANLTNVFPAFCLTLVFGLVGLGFPAAMPPPGRSPRQGFCKIFHCSRSCRGAVSSLALFDPDAAGAVSIALTSATAALRDIFMASFLDKWSGGHLLAKSGRDAPLAGSWQARVSI